MTEYLANWQLSYLKWVTSQETSLWRCAKESLAWSDHSLWFYLAIVCMSVSIGMCYVHIWVLGHPTYLRRTKARLCCPADYHAQALIFLLYVQADLSISTGYIYRQCPRKGNPLEEKRIFSLKMETKTLWFTFFCVGWLRQGCWVTYSAWAFYKSGHY